MMATGSQERARFIIVLPGADVEALLECCAILVRWGVGFRCIFYGFDNEGTQNELKRRIMDLGLYGMVRFRPLEQGKKWERRKSRATVVLDGDSLVESAETLATQFNLIEESEC